MNSEQFEITVKSGKVFKGFSDRREIASMYWIASSQKPDLTSKWFEEDRTRKGLESIIDEIFKEKIGVKS